MKQNSIDIVIQIKYNLLNVIDMMYLVIHYMYHMILFEWYVVKVLCFTLYFFPNKSLFEQSDKTAKFLKIQNKQINGF